jgi:hypothetical protein
MIVSTLQPRSGDEKLMWAKRQVYIALGMLLAQCALNQIDSAIKVIEDMRQDLLSPDLRTRFF